MKGKLVLPLVVVSRDLCVETARLLNSFAVKGPAEGVVYWFGLESPGVAVVTTLIVPDADTATGAVSTSVEANAEVVSALIGTPLVHIGQAHSHPGRSVEHSIVDDEQTFARHDGAISIVVPWFGRYGFNLDECGVHRHLRGSFERVRNVGDHLVLIPGNLDFRRGAQPNG